MKTIYFNPYKDRWICKFSKNDIQNREVLLCILESRGMKIYPDSRLHKDMENYSNILHRDMKEIDESPTNSEIVGMGPGSRNYKPTVIVTFSFILYYFSQKPLF